MNNYITPGELAKLAGTTKRTIHFYDEMGVLKPATVDNKGYRHYRENQVLEYQMILLLATLGVSLNEIKAFVKQKGGLQELFSNKKTLIRQQINELQFNLNNLEGFTANLNNNGTLIKPEIKTLPSFGVYFIEKIGAYSQIGQYCQELSGMFENKGDNFTTLAIFADPTYQPKKSRIKIAVLADSSLVVKPKYQNFVKHMEFNPGKVITYTHNGSGNLLSLFWKEMEKYCRSHNITIRKDVPDFEIYRKVNSDYTKQYFEIYLLIK